MLCLSSSRLYVNVFSLTKVCLRYLLLAPYVAKLGFSKRCCNVPPIVYGLKLNALRSVWSQFTVVLKTKLSRILSCPYNVANTRAVLFSPTEFSSLAIGSSVEVLHGYLSFSNTLTIPTGLSCTGVIE